MTFDFSRRDNQPDESRAERSRALARHLVVPFLRVVVLGGVTVALTVLLSSASQGWSSVVAPGLINLTLVLGLYTFTGVTGIVSFGHVAFMAIGAYSFALFTMPNETKAVMLPDLPATLDGFSVHIVMGLALAGAVACLAGFLTSIPILRLAAVPAAIASFSVLVIVNVVISNWKLIRGGESLTGVPSADGQGVLLGCALLAIGTAGAFDASKIGRQLAASRDDENAALSVGVRVRRYRRFAWTLSSFMTGVGGAMYAHSLGIISFDAFYLQPTFMLLAMLVVGGSSNLVGAFVGTLVISAALEALTRLESGVVVSGFTVDVPDGSRWLGVALIMLVVLLARPNGIVRSPGGGRPLSRFWPDEWRSQRRESGALHDDAATRASLEHN